MQTADRLRWGLFLLILLAYLMGFNGQWRINEDSALYLTLARNVASGDGYKLEGQPHDAVEPAGPYLFAGLMRAAGNHAIPHIQLAILLMSIVALAMVYALVRLRFDRPHAVTLVVLLAATHLFYQHAFYVTTELPFLLGMLAFLIGYERLWRTPDRWTWTNWLLMAAGLMVMLTARPAAITFLVAMGLTALWFIIRGPHRLSHIMIAVMAVACFAGFKAIDPRRPTLAEPVAAEARIFDLFARKPAGLIEQIFTDRLPALFEHATPMSLTSTALGVGFSSLFTLAIIVACVLLTRKRALWGVWLLATFVQMIVLYPHQRYFVPILPLLLVAVWAGMVRLCRAIAEPWSGVSAASVLALLMGWNIARISMLIIEQRSTPFLAHYEDGRFETLQAMANHVRDAVPKADALVLASDPRAMHYFSGRPTIGPLDSDQQADEGVDALLDDYRRRINQSLHVYIVHDERPDLQWLIGALPLTLNQRIAQTAINVETELSSDAAADTTRSLETDLGSGIVLYKAAIEAINPPQDPGIQLPTTPLAPGF